MGEPVSGRSRVRAMQLEALAALPEAAQRRVVDNIRALNADLHSDTRDLTGCEDLHDCGHVLDERRRVDLRQSREQRIAWDAKRAAARDKRMAEGLRVAEEVAASIYADRCAEWRRRSDNVHALNGMPLGRCDPFDVACHACATVGRAPEKYYG